jgi:hypothetical protein
MRWIQPKKVVSIDRPSLKVDEIKYSALYTRPFGCKSFINFVPHATVGKKELNCQQRTQRLLRLFFLHLASVGTYSLKQFGKYSRWQRVFLGSKSKPYMTLANIRTKFRFFSFDFCQNFDVTTFSW